MFRRLFPARRPTLLTTVTVAALFLLLAATLKVRGPETDQPEERPPLRLVLLGAPSQDAR